MDKNEMLRSMSSLKSKLMATVSMLLVSAILLTNVSYAWFVLSTAPEVSGVSTTSGANGALEIALQSTTTTGTAQRAVISSGVGDSSFMENQTIATANTTWGNIVDLSTGYGLEGITLYPSRLNINKTTNHVERNSYLKVPSYGTDGRISDLKYTDKTHYVETGGTGAFESGTNNYGVNVLGFESSLSEPEIVVSLFERETVRIEAVTKVDELRNSLRTELRKAVESNSAGLVNLMFHSTNVDLALSPLEEETIRNLVASLDTIVTKAEQSLRWALLAYAVSDTDTYPPGSNELTDLGDIYKEFLSMPIYSDELDALSIYQIAIENGYSALANSVVALITVQGKMSNAKGLVSQGSYVQAGGQLVSVGTTYLMCGTTDSPARIDRGMEQNMLDDRSEDTLYFVGTEEIEEAGLFPAMASILGDYSAEVIAYMDGVTGVFYNTFPTNAEYPEYVFQYTYHMRVTGQYGESAIKSVQKYKEYAYDEVTETYVGNGGVLMDVYNVASTREAEGQIPISTTRSDVTAYGYSVDLAFRASESGDLVLQQEAASRVSSEYDDPLNPNENLQGGGSVMTFEVYGDMTTDQAERLVESIYVVLMNTDTGEIYAVATADQIDAAFGKVTANLVLHSLNVTQMSEAGDGVLQLGGAITKNVIRRVVADEIYYITAIVFLNGDTVSSADVSPRGISLIGSINLQFALDGVTLEAMRYDDYYTAPSESQGEGS